MTQRHPARPTRRSPVNSLVLGVLTVAVLFAVTGYFAVEARAHRSSHEAVAGGPGGAHVLERIASKIERKAVDLPEEFRQIRAAGVDGAVPSIPPSETWPAQ